MNRPLPIEVDRIAGASARLAAVFKVLANEDRVRLLCRLSQGEACVGTLEDDLGIRQPTLSQQLGVLRAERLVRTRRQGKHVFYSVSDADVLAMLSAVSLLCGARPGAVER